MNSQNLKRFKPSKTWIVLGVALVIGTLAALAARSYLRTQMDAMEARSKGATVKVVVAKKELKRGDKISAETVAVRDIPADYAHSAAVTPTTFDRVDGQTLAYALHPGEMLLWGLMEGKKVPTFSARVEVGHRAMTVPVDEINSISGLLEPGDLIDLVVTIDQKGKKLTLPLLQSVQVMATGQRSVDGTQEGERKHYSTVTIDTTPAQAKNVIIARDAGKVTALLRNPDDKRPTRGGEADMVALLGNAGLAPDTRTIPVLYGGNAKMTADALTMNPVRSAGTSAIDAFSLMPVAARRASATVEMAPSTSTSASP